MIDSDFLLRALMGIGTLAVGWAGWALSKRGQQDTREQQAAANALQTRVNTVDELEAIIARLKEERDHLEGVVELMRSRHQEDYDRQAERCQKTIDKIVDTMATLQSVVQDEIARAAALDVVREAQHHEEDEHGRQWDSEAGGDVRY